MRLTTSIGSFKKSLTKHLNREILIVQGDWNAKAGRDDRHTMEVYVDPTAVLRQMREVLDF